MIVVIIVVIILVIIITTTIITTMVAICSNSSNRIDGLFRLAYNALEFNGIRPRLASLTLLHLPSHQSESTIGALGFRFRV